MAMLKLFKSRTSSVQYVFKNGLMAHFVGGRYTTDKEAQIAELEEEIKLGHPTFYIDEKETEVDSTQLDPLEFIKKKAVAEYIAAQKAKEGTDFGSSDKSAGEGAGMMTSTEIKDVTDASGLVSKLAAIKSK